MADNISVKDSTGTTVAVASKDIGSVQYPKRITVDDTGAVVAVATSALQTSANTKLDTLHTDLVTIDGRVDGIETLIGSTNTLLTTQNGYLDGLEGYVDGLETAFSTLNAKDFATQTTLAAILAKIIAAPATEATLAGYLTARGYAFDVPVTPTVTNGAYSAGDIVGALMTFTVARANDEKVVITGAEIVSKAAVTPAYTLVLFNADPSSTTKTDNAAYSLNAADAFKVIAEIQFGTAWYSHGTVKSIRVDGSNIVAAPVSGGQAIYGLLIDATGATLTSTSDIQVRLRGLGA